MSARRRCRKALRDLRAVAPLALTYTLFVAATGTVCALLEGWPVTDGWWWAAVTTTTTGYGDLSPASGPGRVVGWITMLGGIVFIGHIVARVVSTRDRWTHEEQLAMFRLLSRILTAIKERNRADA